MEETELEHIDISEIPGVLGVVERGSPTPGGLMGSALSVEMTGILLDLFSVVLGGHVKAKCVGCRKLVSHPLGRGHQEGNIW